MVGDIQKNKGLGFLLRKQLDIKFIPYIVSDNG